MTSLTTIGIILIVAVVLVGVCVKLFTRRRLKDMDGVDTDVVIRETDS